MTQEPRPIPQPIPGRALQKVLNKGLRLPLSVVHPAIRGVKIAASPGQYRLRRQLAERIRSELSESARIPWQQGHRFFGPDDLPGVRAAVNLCTELFEKPETASRRASFQRNPRKDFLLSILAGSDVSDHPALVRFMISRPLLDLVTDYLGSVPLLAGANLWWSPVNQTQRSSQLYHVDREDTRQMKLFINVTETTADSGPLTFLPPGPSDRVRQFVGRGVRRIQDAQVVDAGVEEQAFELVGPPGTGLFLDTARCLHFGSRVARRDRLVLAIQFLRFDSPSEATIPFRFDPALAGFEPDLVQRLALGIHPTRGTR